MHQKKYVCAETNEFYKLHGLNGSSKLVPTDERTKMPDD